MSARIADLIFRFRYALCGIIVLGFFALLPLTNLTAIDNDLTTWISRDDTIHFICRFRREINDGATTAAAIEAATMHEGRASLTTAIINSLGYGIMVLSAYKPTAWFGGLLALTMAVAFLAEVFVVPAVITLLPRVFGARRVARLGIATASNA